MSAVAKIGKNVTGVQADASKLDDLDRLYATIKQQKGRLDIVFANAGGADFFPLGSITEEHFDQIFATNVKGVLFAVQKALPLMPDGSYVILNASISSIKALPTFSAYSATKAAVRSFARTWTVDLRDRKIRVNAVSPGFVPTPPYARFGFEGPEFEEQTVKQFPLGRLGPTSDIAKAVVFLASDDSSYVSGIELFVGGGMAQI